MWKWLVFLFREQARDKLPIMAQLFFRGKKNKSEWVYYFLPALLPNFYHEDYLFKHEKQAYTV